ncbi:T9SS type B sorting domain-containing protein [Flavobacterium sp. Sr18]|uniref:T9SS type B sorting domain-containing protein n=1 Tax=Flavobacterium sp. Sr18 TaxID=935222 RepID=UPI0013E4BFBC|nr:T9SS type B sorting domain-containing protein [Flavobacterium sp. Sr18]QIH37318.1 T9SS type B sorting domain-containing protein [Flavobacterium sp. Sr18]
MKFKLFLLMTLYTSLAFSQQETSVWYFGKNAGLKFQADGSVAALTDGQLDTNEGCATLADSNGNLLFYTDGTTVYNKNHQVMQNGTGLMGNWSSTQSATIVPKPGSTNLYYVFTLDYEVHPNGFRYSIVDSSLNGGLGAVTSEKNVLIYTPSDEKLSIVKHANNTDYWVVTHGWNSNTFYSYLLTSSGLSATPVSSDAGMVVSGSTDNVWGYMKIAPDGSKLAICHAIKNCELLDFDNATGLVSNPIVLRTGDGMYGVEFSPNSEILYLSVTNPSPYKVIQYDLTSSDIVGSAFTTLIPSIFPCALQLGPNGKIYIAEYGKQKLGVINNPNSLGAACDLQMNAVDLAGRICGMGLPPFVSSFFFNSAIEFNNSCLAQTTQFTLNTNQTVTSATWNFGDGNTSNDLNPTHTYATAGTYTVSVLATSTAGTSTKNRSIVISQVPTATAPQNMLICDDNNDGLYIFDLTTQNPAILNGQDPNSYSINYFANTTDYTNNVAIAAPGNYINTIPYQQQTIIAEVSNKVNTTCKRTTSFSIDVFDSPLPSLPINILNLTVCDNTSVGTDTDGRVIFDLTQRASTVLNGQSATQFSLSYFKDVALTQNIATPEAYENTNPTETIYVKMVNKDNGSCSATTSFTIQVLALPIITNGVDLKQCDDNSDGFSVFNLEEGISKITNNASSETISFYKTQTDAQNNTNPISNATDYTNQIVSSDKVYVRVANSNGCYRIAQLNLIVSTTQIPLNFTRTFTQCDDAISGTNTDGISSFDFSNLTNQIQNIFPIGQQLDITYYRNLVDALAEKDAISDISNYRNIGYPNTQNVYIRVDSRLNNDCLGLGSHITLNVEAIPVVKPVIESRCDDNQDGVYAFDTSGLQTKLLNGLTNVTVAYFDQNNNSLPSPLPNPFTTASQTLKVVVTNSTSKACSFDSTIQFIVSDLPEAFPVPTSLTTICDDETDPNLQDGKYAFDTSTFQNTILNGQTGMTVHYFDGNSNLLSSPLPNPFVTETQNIRVEVINQLNNSCAAAVILPFVVNPVPNINLLGDELVCSNLSTFTKVIDAGIQDGSPIANYSYAWFFNGNPIAGENNYTLTVNKAGIYTVEVSNAQGCSRTRTITVMASDIAKITEINIVDLADSNSITISVSGAGDYVYALDEEFSMYQTENTFGNVPAGIHTVFVKDLNGCGVVPKEVAVLGIPNYFTPNGDGFNDTWNLKGANETLNLKTIIQIFDRYGKLIKQISPVGEGWNGTFNGQQMPATDYWYSIQLEDGRIIKGHFALKR